MAMHAVPDFEYAVLKENYKIILKIHIPKKLAGLKISNTFLFLSYFGNLNGFWIFP
jgi:hypothetical protein